MPFVPMLLHQASPQIDVVAQSPGAAARGPQILPGARRAAHEGRGQGGREHRVVGVVRIPETLRGEPLLA